MKRYGKNIQLWPGGESVCVHGEGDALRVRSSDGKWRKPSKELARKCEIELLAEMYADRYIWHCDTCLVCDMMEAAQSGEISGEMSHEWDWEKVSNLRPDPDNWDLEECREYCDDHGIGHPDPDPWEKEGEEDEKEYLLDILGLDEDDDEYKKLKKSNVDDLRLEVIRRINNEEIDGLDDWRDEIRDRAEQAEVYEWYRVDPWLAKQLDRIGECVLDNNYGEWWGRCATGQSLIMDGTLQRIAAKHARNVAA